MGMEYKITDLLAMAFDIKMPIHIPDVATVAKGKIGQSYTLSEAKKNEAGVYYPVINVKDEDNTSTVVSWMGTPVMFPITFKGEGLDKPYKVYQPSGELQDVTMQNFLIPAATVVDFSRAKNIIQTDVLGGDGTVKELFGFDDWQIRMRGFCLTDNSRPTAKTAQEQKETLMKWESIAGSIKVEGSLFAEKNIREIVIESINIKQIQGRPWAISFEISAMSNEAVRLVL